MSNSHFVTIVNNQNRSLPKSFDEVRFEVSDDSRLHLGDRFFLQKICDRLNAGKPDSSFIASLSIIRRLSKCKSGFHIGLDWSKPMYLSVDEHIRYALKNIWSDVEVFQLHKSGCKQKIILSTEIASNKLRVIGLRKKFVPILQIFTSEGFEIVHHGKNLPSWLLKYGINISENIDDLKVGESLIATGAYYAYVGYDNFWMHVSAFHNLQRYIVQRRKFSIVNFLNHVSSLNMSTVDAVMHYIS
jgi:hypothetical protein